MAVVKKIFILHGWTYSLDRWKKLEELLKKAGIEPVFLKIPGLTAPIGGPWGIYDYVKWLSNALQAENKIILLGHSNGGRIAVNFAIANPEKIKHLILIDSAGIHSNQLSARLKIKRKVFKLVATVGKKFIKSALAKKILYCLAGESDYYNADEVMKQTMVNLLDSDKLLDLKKISVPATIIWGTKDRITPYADAEIFHREIKDSKIYPIEARHAPFDTNSEDVARIIEDIYEYL